MAVEKRGQIQKPLCLWGKTKQSRLLHRSRPEEKIWEISERNTQKELCEIFPLDYDSLMLTSTREIQFLGVQTMELSVNI